MKKKDLSPLPSLNWNILIEELFEYVPPEQMRKSIHEIFSRYLQTINTDEDMAEFKLIAEDFYFLYKFLEKAEMVYTTGFDKP